MKHIFCLLSAFAMVRGGLDAQQQTSCSLAATTLPAAGFDVTSFGAKCDFNGISGTDDTTAFVSAAAAASARYSATRSPVEIAIPNGCVVAGSVRYGSGVHWRGGSIFVPMQQPTPTLLAENADDVAVDGLSVTVLNHSAACASSQNNADCVAIAYRTTDADDSVTHSKVSFTHNTVIESSWGILVIAQGGHDHVTDIHVDNNTVKSTTPYSYNDGIHVGGAVSLFTIANNNVYGRRDAAIAVTSEVNGLYLCSGGTITGNTLLEDIVGIDNSGCSHLTVTGNFVRATMPNTSTVNGNSNPAFRSILYAGTLPVDVNVKDNTFLNYPGTEYGSKFDMYGQRPGDSNDTGSSFVGNTTNGLYLRVSNVAVAQNTFVDGSKLNCDYDYEKGIGSNKLLIGANMWLGSGNITCNGNPGLLQNDFLLPQLHTGPLTIAATTALQMAQ